MAVIDGLSGDVSSDDSRLLVEAMRHLADQQVARAERVRTSARQTFAYLTGIFTLAQAGTLAAFAHHGMPEWTEGVTLGLALGTVGCLGLAGFFAIRAEQLKPAPEIAPIDITKAADDAELSGESIGDGLVMLYARRIDQQGAVINSRRMPLKDLTSVALVTILLVVLELAAALIGRFG
jgi:hypothetical protein